MINVFIGLRVAVLGVGLAGYIRSLRAVDTATGSATRSTRSFSSALRGGLSASLGITIGLLINTRQQLRGIQQEIEDVRNSTTRAITSRINLEIEQGNIEGARQIATNFIQSQLSEIDQINDNGIFESGINSLTGNSDVQAIRDIRSSINEVQRLVNGITPETIQINLEANTAATDRSFTGARIETSSTTRSSDGRGSLLHGSAD